MKIIYIILLSLPLATLVRGEGIEEALRLVAANNRELKINDYQSLAVNSQYAAMNALPGPSVSYTRQYGERAGINGELIASQGFDFPSLYVERSRLALSKARSLETRQGELRRQILLEAKEICLDLILLRKEGGLLDERLNNAAELERLYLKRLETGDANRLETNRISLELLNVKTAARRNAIAIEAKLKDLEALNGGIPLAFDDNIYGAPEGLPSLEDLLSEHLAVDPSLGALRSEEAVAKQALKVSRAGWLPSFEVGYQLNTATGGERFSGFLVGISLPVFSNRHKVREAKAGIIYSALRYEGEAAKSASELRQLYRRSLALRESMDEYRRLLDEGDNLSPINKALQSGRISMIEYFAELTSLYESRSSYMQIENDYRKTSARLLRHRL
ncbi:MAG: TolC family protein [Tannerellaceae bacterium]|jgi:outer membrane protein TolC|nr:TolC family protein [Tannerellaceae bacterium]